MRERAGVGAAWGPRGVGAGGAWGHWGAGAGDPGDPPRARAWRSLADPGADDARRRGESGTDRGWDGRGAGPGRDGSRRSPIWDVSGHGPEQDSSHRGPGQRVSRDGPQPHGNGHEPQQNSSHRSTGRDGSRDGLTHDGSRPSRDSNRRRPRRATGDVWDGSDAGAVSGPGSTNRQPTPVKPELRPTVPHGCAVDRWVAEARILLGAEGRSAGRVLVRFGGRRRLVLEISADDDLIRPVPTPTAGTVSALPVLPDTATWVLPDLELLRTGAIEADRLHPLVAAALAPDRSTATGPPRVPDGPAQQRLVECRGARHRIGLVDGVLAPLDHDPDEIRREELLAALTGTPLPCLQAIDEAHRRPHCLDGVRERLVHGDTAGALAVVEALLGPEALLRTGPLRDELEAAALRRITYGLFRTGLSGPNPARFAPGPSAGGSRSRRTRPRHATSR
ncbi:hypothetical protein AB0D34_00645 [Streptomyces sp. NPDC048420]|uniref:hypothetical protein n=1 Tax=Streptomyces sp. NPDC048420 TaxID=3155755 RepID=UPI003420ECCD